ncbi:hypothetical protein [Spiroplasma endosymbiont of Lasioglossum malachurum]|uniref:hypothetical protein n=1 Tax=Spiroplasma endosymbiont of Lasioglossum malachurum TaxID=3066319 RepID=UPI0030D1B824
MQNNLNIMFLVNWSDFSIKDWIIIGLSILLLIITFIFILVIFLLKRKRFKFKINNIISDNLVKIGKNNYKFSSRNAFILFNEIKSIILDKRYKYFYKFKKRYKDGSLNNELFDIVQKYYLKNEKELKKKPKPLFENKKNDKPSDAVNKKDDKKVKFVFDDQEMTVKIEEDK